MGNAKGATVLPDRFYTPNGLAKSGMVPMCAKTIVQRIESGELKAMDIGMGSRKRWKVKGADFIAFAEGMRSAGGTADGKA